ncbi:MAG TPA: carbohydrate ABC transporter permease [Gaiellaceae bacterium]|nr:carbohydrate ABC transporter permease [Gaiellaceae bacterium]
MPASPRRASWLARHVSRQAAYAGLLVWAVATTIPIWAALTASFKSTSEVISNPLGIPHALHPDNYVAAWTGRIGAGTYYGIQSEPLYRFGLHSVLAVSIGVALAMGTGTLAGYALARNAERLNFLNRYFIVLLALPAIATWVPLFSLMESLGLLASPAGLGLVYGAMVTPLVTVLMRTYFSSFPLDLVEAARVDGASESFAFARIVLPMSKGVLTVVALIQAVFLWNELAVAEILLVTPDRGTLPMGLIAFKSQFASNLGPQFAALVLAIVPVTLLYIVAQGRITQGIRLGALR